MTGLPCLAHTSRLARLWIQRLSQSFAQIRIQTAHLKRAANGSEFYQKVDIAVLRRFTAGIGAKQREALDTIRLDYGNGNTLDLFNSIYHYTRLLSLHSVS